MTTLKRNRSRADARATGLIMGVDAFTVCLQDGRSISVPYHCFPRLERATPEKRSHFEVYGDGRLLHWPEIDEDIEVQHIADGRLPVKEPRMTAVAEAHIRYGSSA
jgi:hypothetical protein